MRYAFVLLASLLLAPAAASAEVVLGLDVSGNADPISESADSDIGTGIEGRLGARLDQGGFLVQPELVAGWQVFVPRRLDGDIRQTHGAFRGMVGGRLGFGQVLRPTVFAHAGAAYYDPSYLVPAGHFEVVGSARRPDAGFVPAVDIGAALDLVALPMFEIGVHGSYNRLLLVDPLDWLALGAHVAVVFP